MRENLAIFGATRDGALLEGSKGFAKSIMSEAGVPTAAYSEVKSRAEADKYCASAAYPLVLKADGLAAGKGVVICRNQEEANEGLDFLFGEIKADCLVIEEFVEGVEASYIIATDGDRVVPLATSHDYKRIFEGNQGPNTGGMGAISPTPFISAEKEKEILATVIQPTIEKMKERGTTFSGFLYAGLILRKDGTPSVLEFNTRLGDPECQSIMRRVDFDLAKLLFALATKTELPPISWKKETAVCVVMASAGYPNKHRVGDLIQGIEEAEKDDSVKVFHAGTKRADNKSIVTAGGRVLSVTALGKDFETAKTKAYDAVNKISFEGSHIRRDIGESNECKIQN